MHSKISRIAEGTYNCPIEIKSLQEELAACHSEINGLSLQLKEVSKPFGSEETLDSDERVLNRTGLPNMKILKAVFHHVVTTLPAEGVESCLYFSSLSAH